MREKEIHLIQNKFNKIELDINEVKRSDETKHINTNDLSQFQWTFRLSIAMTIFCLIPWQRRQHWQSMTRSFVNKFLHLTLIHIY